jgi:glucokinase
MWAIGVDVGGSKTSVGLVDTASARIVEHVDLATPPLDETGQRFLDAVAETAKGLLARIADANTPVGVGICELVDVDGEIVSAHRVNWRSREVRSVFGFAGRVTIEADVRAAAAAEAVHGAGVGLRHWIYANAGTGIATVLMDGETPYLGAHGRGLASGLGPVTFLSANPSGWSVEDVAGGAGMLNRARAAGLSVDRFAELIDPANTDQTAGNEIVREGGAVLGRILGLLANTLDPEAIVLGGGIALASDDYTAACRDAFRETIWFTDAGIPEIRLARLGPSSGLVGAAMAAVREPDAFKTTAA